MDIDRLSVSELKQKSFLREAGASLRAYRPGLRLKLTMLVSGITLASLLLSTTLLFDFQRRQIYQNAEAASLAISNTIKSNLRHAMLSVDRKMMDDIIQTVVSADAVESVRILNARGVVAASSDGAEVGRLYDRAQPGCQYCHAAKAGNIPSSAIFTADPGRSILFDVDTFTNDAECQGCHANDGRVLGLLIVQTPLDKVQAQLTAGYWRTGLIALGTFVFLVGALVLTLRRYIINPVKKLEKGVAEISAGNLDGEFSIANQDELGRLAQSMDAMREQLLGARTEMEHRNQELSVLNEVALTVSQSLDLHEILDRALATVTERLGIEAGFIRLMDPDTGNLDLAACKGASDAVCHEIEQRRKNPGRDISAEVVKSGNTYYAASMASEYRFEGLWDALDKRFFILVPMKSRRGVIGTLALLGYPNRPLGERAIVVVEAIANEIGIAIENALLLAEAQKNEHEAVTLSQLGTQVSASLALKEVLNAVAEGARKLLKADIGLVGLVEEDHQVFVLKAAAGLQPEALIGIRASTTQRSSREGWMSGQPVIADFRDPGQPVLFDADLIKDEPIASFLVVPLERGERVMGLIQVMTRQPRQFTPPDAELLMRLAHHVVVAIENARLYRQLRNMAVLEERDRLAREIHDHLSQTLGYMNIKTSMIDDQLSQAQVTRAREGLQELKDAAKIAYTDVREAIFNLRTSVSPESGLLRTLQTYLSEYHLHYGLDTALIVAEGDLVEMPPESAAQILRIIQEALVNVRRHSGADTVRIICQTEGDQLSVIIEDNGQGFTPTQAPGADKQHYGLQIMRERAESVGGSLTLDSHPGQGTRVIVRIPVQFQEVEGSWLN